MPLLPDRTVTVAQQGNNVVDDASVEPSKQAGQAEPGQVDDQGLLDSVDQASYESFPASDAPPWTLGCSDPPTPGQDDGCIEDGDPL